MLSDNIYIERYKFILEQKRALNDRTFKVASFYQLAMVAILTGQFQIMYLSNKGELRHDLSLIGSWGLFLLSLMVALISVILILGGVAAWINYRKDEAEIEEKALGVARPLPSASQLWMWYETYIVLGIALATFIYLIAIVYLIEPKV